MAEADEKEPYRWGMVVDLDRCTGCEACVVACHAENNIRISGEREAAEGRAITGFALSATGKASIRM